MSISTLRDQFREPAVEYGPIDCWWWEAGHLRKDRLTWQLEQMREQGIAGTWFYPRFFTDEPLGSDPRYWTQQWWEFTRFAVQEHRRLGMIAWFSDWTAHQFFQNILRGERDNHPELTGRRLVIHQEESSAESKLRIDIPAAEEVLDAAAYRKTDGGVDYASRTVLTDAIRDNTVTWRAPDAGWVLTVVAARPDELDYLNRSVVDRWMAISLGVYEQKLPEFVGKTLAAYGPDEMRILKPDLSGGSRILYSPSLVERFRADKGYDPRAYLVGLFHDIGQQTDKIRCGYYDVMVSLLEENWYRPIPQWLHERGMSYTTIATEGRQDILEQTRHYGDFFRMMRCFDVTGNEDPRAMSIGDRRFIDAKLSSSVTHLYQRDRTAVCVYWSSGWGVTQQQNVTWTNANYAYGINLYNRHGGLYSTLGGWYEWVPPAIHFRQPYWQYWKYFTDYVRRLSYIMSQGVHCADVAVLYPITTVHANWFDADHFTDAGEQSAVSTFDLARQIYRSGIDFDFIDYPSLCNAQVRDGKLIVAGVEFRVLVLPPITTIRTETLEKIKAFYDAGGTVIAVRRLPTASPEHGRDDPNIRSLVTGIFGAGEQQNEQGGKAFFLGDDESRVPEIITTAVVTDVVACDSDIFHTHQKIDEVDVYFLFNATEQARSISVVFRVSGEPEIWDAFTGRTRPVHRFQTQGDRTKVRVDMAPYEAIVLVFGARRDRPQVVEDNLTTITKVQAHEDRIELDGFCDAGGSKRIRITDGSREYTSQIDLDPVPEPIVLDGLWDFSLAPTMDNQWGDFRYPASDELIGAEARRFRYMEEGRQSGTELGWHTREFDDSDWPNVTYSYGPYWWTIGPFEAGKEPEELLEQAKSGKIETDRRYEIAGQFFQWRRHRYSQKFGHEAAAARQTMGLRGVCENFLVFPAVEGVKSPARYLFAFVHSPEQRDYRFEFGGDAEFTRQAWINGEPASAEANVTLNKGWNCVLLKLVHPEGQEIRTFAVFQEPTADRSFDPYVPLLRWFVQPQDLLFDITPQRQKRVGWYRFVAPPGLESMTLNANAKNVAAWIDAEPLAVQAGKIALESPRPTASQVVLRVEQNPGRYAGAAFDQPVGFQCETGKIPLGDWCEYGLETYSGAGVYCKTVELEERHLKGKVLLHLERASTVAEVHVNDKPVGVRMAKPFCFDITDAVEVGTNHIRIKVANTLANHMSTYPTKFAKNTVSGLHPPVTLQFLSQVRLTGVPAG